MLQAAMSDGSSHKNEGEFQIDYTQLTGAIRKLKDGFGFIACDDGQDYFFHWSACCIDSKNFRDLQVQERVTFNLARGPRGPRAVMVRVI